MAKSAETWEGRRALTDNPNTSREAARAAAQTLISLNLLTEAALFFNRAEDSDGLREIMSRAAGEGNFFVFREAAARLGEDISRDQVHSLISAAEQSGKQLYAEKAAEYLETL